MTTITFADEKPKNVATRKDLRPGTVFVYESSKQLHLVPDPAFSRHHNVAEKDIAIGGPHSGSLDDYHPDLVVTVVDLTVSKSAHQPAPVGA